MPTTGQLILLIASILIFTAGGIVSLSRLKWGASEKLRIAAKACMYFGILSGVIVLVWHSITRGSWLPLRDNFDALIWLAMLLAVFVMYMQRVHPLPGLDWFVMPIVIVLLICAAAFGGSMPREYVTNTWSWVHRVTSYTGAIAFAVAGAVGTMYLITNRRLRTKASPDGPNFGSLERLENLTRSSVILGFALLTIGTITGVVEMIEGQTTATLKIVLALSVWLVYGIVLHAPINPSFRGRRTAALSVIGFLLMLGTILAVMFTSTGGAH